MNAILPKNQKELIRDLAEKNRALNATYKLYEIILESLEFEEMTQKIADTIPQTLGYETGVLALTDQRAKTLVRVAISQTSGGTAALENLEIPFKNIVIPLEYDKNVCIKAINTGKQQVSYDLFDVLRPAVSKENSRLVQEEMGTVLSVVTPLYAHGNAIGVFIVSTSKPQTKITAFESELIQKFTDGIGVAIENSRLYTDLKKTKEDLHKAYTNLEALDRLKDEFISIASHELRTPMTIIRGYLWMLMQGKGGSLTEKQKLYIQKANKGTERLIALVNDMLNISRIEQGRLDLDIEKVSLAEFLQEMCEEFKIKTEEKGIYLKMEVDNAIDQVYADRNKLSEVFVNLIGNSIKFTSQGGITIKAIDAQEGFVKVLIKDTGQGIAPEDTQRLFKKFGRLDNSYQTVAEAGGTGLGLYISKQYIEAMHGSIGVMSEGIGHGTTFWFTLPTTKDAEFIQKNRESIKALALATPQEKITTLKC